MRAPNPIPKPRKRSPLRKFLGRRYYILKRRWQWQFSATKFARRRSAPLDEVIFTHRTPLMRKLRNVDMWMQENKKKNLSLAAPRIDRIVIQPGETFSYWRLIGNPNALRGYVKGMVLDQGKVKPGVGGGLCQMSNLLFWMAMHSPLTVVERWRHSFDVFPDVNRKQPFGSGATCSYNYIDLQLRNDTDQPFQFRVFMDETYLQGEIRTDRSIPWTYEVFEEDHHIRTEIWGYTRHNRISRYVRDRETGEDLHTETLVENHAIMMYNPMLEEGSREEE